MTTQIPPSSLTTLISSLSTPDNEPPTPLSATTTQILHNLQHQHLWTSLQVHQLNTNTNTNKNNTDTTTFLISGTPPHRIYTHPDEQLFMLEKGLREEDIDPETVFVLPTAQGQKWSLGMMARVFDALPEFPDVGHGRDRAPPGSGTSGGGEGEASVSRDNKEKALDEYYERRDKARLTNEWGGKRLLLAMVDKGMGGDGTVVYYVVQEGAVKPRQN